MKRIFCSIMFLLIVINFCIAYLPQAVSASELVTEPESEPEAEIEAEHESELKTEPETEAPKPNVWNGDKLAVPIEAGKNGYTLRSVYVSPYHAYEMSNHMVSQNGGESNDIPQTLMLVDATSSYTWTPSGLFSPSSSNYRVLYCCDAVTGYNNGVYYKRLNLEDSPYYTDEAAKHIRSIVSYSYPFVDLDVMKTRLSADGFGDADKLTRAEIITAVQSAIWAYANTEEGLYTYSQTFDVPSNSQWGGVVHDYTNEMDVWWTVGKRKFSTSDEVSDRIDSLIAFLTGLEGVTAGRDEIIITGLDIEDCVPIIEKDGVYTVALKLNLNTSGNDGDSVDINVYVDDQLTTVIPVTHGVDSYNIIVQARSGETIKAVVSGKQYVAKGVYFYEAEGGRDASQSLVDVASGETDIYCEAEVVLSEIPKSPKADVTLCKTDNNGTPLVGARFDLYVMGTAAYVYADTYSVDENGQLSLLDLVPGTYAIRETTTPDGFHSLNSDIEFMVTEDGEVETVSLPDDVFLLGAEGKYTIYIVNIPQFISVSGEKTWDDEDDFDGLRPESITINLLADGIVVQTMTVGEEDGWKWSFNNLPTIIDGKKIAYTITEEKVDSYETVIDGYNVINKHVPEKVEVSGRKNWNDADDRDRLRPESITVKLLANGETVQSKSVGEADGWKWSFTDLPKYKHGKIIEYTIEEEAVDGYTYVVDGYNVTNTYEPKKTSVKVEKAWNDDDNRDGIRPDRVVVKLLANGIDTGREALLSEANNWSAEFTDLYVNENGVPIQYTVAEIVPSGYVSIIEGSAALGYKITNVHEPERIAIPVEKIWRDNDDRYGLRPLSIVVILYADGVDTGRFAVLGNYNNWRAEFTDLYAKSNGKDIVYSVGEVLVEGYSSSITGDADNGFIVTNTYKPQKVSIRLMKQWDDDNNSDGCRPSYVLVRLLADGEDTGIIIEVSEANGWSATVTGLDAYKNGKKINYTVEEIVPDGYSVTIIGDAASGFVITNSREREKIDISGQKFWEDNDNKSGNRPASITINLWADDVIVESKVVTEADGWAWTFEDLDVYKNGSEIQYRITEDAVPGYETVYHGFDVVNTANKGNVNIDIPVSKIWEDVDNALGVRPDNIIVELIANGVTTDLTLTLSADNNWSDSFTSLPVFDDDGNRINYTVRERDVEAYVSKITGDADSGFSITNVYVEEPETDPLPQSPNTADPISLLAIMLAFSASGLVITACVKKKRQ